MSVKHDTAPRRGLPEGGLPLSRLASILPVTIVLCFAADSPQQQSKPPADKSEMSSEVHGTLFQGPKSLNAGATTERVAGSLPRRAVGAAPIPHRNFSDA